MTTTLPTNRAHRAHARLRTVLGLVCLMMLAHALVQGLVFDEWITASAWFALGVVLAVNIPPARGRRHW